MSAVRFHLLLLLLIPLFAGAQNPSDSTAPVLPTRIRIYSENEWASDPKAARPLPRLLDDFDATDSDVIRYQDLGISGSASKKLELDPSSVIWPNAGWSSSNRFFMTGDAINYWRTNKRFTQLDYRMGSFRQQTIEGLHCQNIKTNWNSGFYFNRANVLDYIPNSDTYLGRFVFFTDFGTKNDRYHAFLHALWNTTRNEINGGIRYDSMVTASTGNLDLRGLPVRLNDAAYRLREKAFHLGQYWGLSAQPANPWKLNSAHTLSYGSFAYEDQSADSSFYKDYYSGPTTYDTISYSDFRNRLGICRVPTDSSLRLNIFLENRLFEYRQEQSESVSNTGAGMDATYVKRQWSVGVGGQQLFIGSEKGNRSADIRFGVRLGSWSFLVNGKTGISAVPQVFRYFNGNHFRWTNTGFDAVESLQGGVTVRSEKAGTTLSVRRCSVNGYLFMNQESLPEQAIDPVAATTTELSQVFRWRHWTTSHRVIWQQPDSKEYLRLPEWTTLHSLWWEDDLYHNAFRIQTGVDARYLSSFQGDAFMPATGFYYLQDGLVTGEFLRLDLFLRLQIKTAALYLRLENAGAGTVTDPYYLTPYQPQPGRVFRFGVRWRFFDQ